VINQSLSIAPQLGALSAAQAADLLTLPSGARLAVKRWGRGPPVLCLHAVGHGSGDFAELAGRLGEAFEFIAIDWPGMGCSPPDGLPVRADRLAGLVLEVAEALRLDRPLVIGNSIGGAAAIIAAAAAPERFSALVLSQGQCWPVSPPHPSNALQTTRSPAWSLPGSLRDKCRSG